MTRPTRIIVLGRSGAGKSTFTRMAAEALDLPAVHLDQLFWQPGWVEGEREEFLSKVAAVAKQDGWIVDGGYRITWPHTMPRAHAIVYLDLPRWQSMVGITKRILTTYGKVRVDSAPGCPERFDVDFIKYVWTWDKAVGPVVAHAIETRPSGCALHVIKHRREMGAVIKALSTD